MFIGKVCKSQSDLEWFVLSFPHQNIVYCPVSNKPASTKQPCEMYKIFSVFSYLPVINCKIWQTQQNICQIVLVTKIYLNLRNSLMITGPVTEYSVTDVIFCDFWS